MNENQKLTEESGDSPRSSRLTGSEWWEDLVDPIDEDAEDNTCPRCHGIGGDPMDDYCTPCDHCEGQGYEWWK